MNSTLNSKQYEIILEEVVQKISNRVYLDEQSERKYLAEVKFDITLAIRTGELDECAKFYGFTSTLEKLNESASKNKRILLLGHSNLKKKDLNRMISSRYIDHIDYDLKKFDARIVNGRYEFVLAGPVPHKGKGMGNNNSIISSLEKNDSIHLQRLQTNTLKITKNTIEKSLNNILIC